MNKFIFDIETVGEHFDSMDKITQHELTKRIKMDATSDDEYEKSLHDLKDRLGLSPLTGQIVAIGVISCTVEQGAVYYQAPGETIKEHEEAGVKYKQMTEEEMLRKFWELADKCVEFVTFNGRCFDLPFILIRSAMYKIRAPKNFMKGRYLYQQHFDAKHVDLLDQLTFYGATKKGTLHMYTRAFGIESPKSEDINGYEVAKLFEQKRFLDIAKYNARDIQATKKLYEYWDTYMRFS